MIERKVIDWPNRPRRPLTNYSLPYKKSVSAAFPIVAALPIAVFAAFAAPVDDDVKIEPDEHFDAMDNDESDEQAPDDDYEDKLIKFLPFEVWNNSEENYIEYILPPSYADGGADWVGVFKVTF